jgi:glutamate-5-semialdehyde dehydrogenase
MSLTSASPVEVAESASLASRTLAVLPSKERNDALTAIHSALLAAKEEILDANKKDLVDATKAAENGSLSQSVLKRLDLAKPGKFEDMLTGILDVRDLDDPSTLL